jgi:hypothetical protein
MLGQVPALTSGGELREVWYWGVARNGLCGCGERFRDCPFWRRVGSEAFGRWDDVPLEPILRAVAAPGAPAAAGLWLRWMGPSRDDRRLLARTLPALYGAVGDAGRATIVVDSTKLPSYAARLRRVPELDVRLVHLIRDGRAVAYSWSRKVVRADVEGDAEMHRFRPGRIALRWNGRNLAAEWLGRSVPYLRVRYEDLVRDPPGELERVLVFAGVVADASQLAFVRRDEVELGVAHTLMGNPSRMLSGVQPIRSDDAWRTRMPAQDVRTVTLLTAPLLRRYGYPRRVQP